MLTVETMRDDDDKGGDAVGGGGLGLCERRCVGSGAGDCMKPRPRIEKPRPAWRNYSSSSRSSMALDCLVEVALSPTAALSLDLSGRDNAGESAAALRTPSRPDGQGDEGKDDDDAAMGRYWSCSSAVKSPEPAAALAPSPSPGFYQQRQQQQQQQQRQEEQKLKRQEEQKLKLRRGLSSWTAMSHPAGRSSSSSSSSSLRVHADHPHSKRFTPRFKSLLDISC